MTKLRNGTVDSSQTIKAGCGIRYDPEKLNAESGFDFSNASKLLEKDQSGQDLTDDKSRNIVKNP